MKNKRIFAFFIDMIIISLLTICLSGIPRINPYIEKYDETISKYNEISDNAYEEFLETKDASGFLNKISKYMYKLEKYSIVTSLLYIFIFILYFGVFQYVTGGETVGKKIFKLIVVNEDGSDVSIIKMICRCLINGNSLYYGFNLLLIIRVICVCILTETVYIKVFFYLLFISFILDLIFIFTYLFRKDNKGLNDLIFKTKVIERIN